MRLFCLFILTLFLAMPAQAELRIDIKRGTVNPLPIALPEPATSTPEHRDIGAKLMGVVANNLERSGLFAPINKQAYLESIQSVGMLPTFPDWQQINAQALLVGEIKPGANGNLDIQFRLWDTLAEKQIAGKSYSTAPQNWRRVAHLISDIIYERITGETGYFDSRIVYIAETGDPRKRVKRLAIMDQDSANHRYLSDGKDLVLTPRFDHRSQRIIYMAYHGNKPKVYLYDLPTGREVPLGSFVGMSFAPRFSHDGNYVIFSMAENGNTEIYEMDLRSKKVTQLTDHPAIDTSPSYAPDGDHIVFNSDRGGSSQLYVMKRNGAEVRRISFGDGRYSTPVWSPRGDLIAFTKSHGGRFHIGVMRPDGSGERLLTESFLDEGPTWSPNGRVIIFTRQKRRYRERGLSQLMSLDLTGYNEREIPTPVDGSDPAWSPLLSE